ncbi:MAG TPA: hypothetical protein VJX72_11550 [Candidatus Acidoferrum sp.]|nr:hypothetical protein [Candidatus Acidoferrum sp.]
MRDWHAFVQERLGSLHGVQREREQITSELAGHLEEYYEVLRSKGLAEEAALARTCAQAGDWEILRRGIVLAKEEGIMQERVWQIWIPSLVTLVSSTVVLSGLIGTGTRPIIWHPEEPRGVILYIPWLLLLPLIGAVGGYLSRRAQGSGWQVYVAGLFPALAMGLVMMLIFPFAFVINPQVAPQFKFISLMAMVVSWVVLPGIALCIGVALQGLRKSQAG